MPLLTTRSVWCWLATLGLLCLTVLYGTPAQAYQRSYLNLGFEDPVIAPNPPCRLYIASDRVPGWNTNSPIGNEAQSTCTNNIPVTGRGQLIELWKAPRDITGGTATTNRMPAREGSQFAELNADKISELTQTVCLINGETVDWQFSHNGRNTANDTMQFRAGTQAIASISTSTTGVGSVTTCNSGTCNVVSQVTTQDGIPRWADYTGTFVYTGPSGTVPLGFKSTSGSNTNGNFLDGVQIRVKPIIEFTSANYSTPESNLNPPAVQVIVVGIIPTGGVTLTFNVNSVTALIGTDYLINGGTTPTFNVTVPAGDYGMGTPLTINIPVQLVNDTVNEPDETFTVSLAPDPAFFLLSASACGASGNGTTTYTIIDDDAPTDQDLRIVKTQRAGTSGPFQSTPLSVQRSSTVQYRLVVSNVGPNPVPFTSQATFRDIVPSNITGLSVVSTSSSVSGQACTASFTGNTLNGRFSGANGTTCTVVIQGTASTSGQFDNTATVSPNAANTEIYPPDNTSTVRTNVAHAYLVLNKISSGGTDTFGFTLTNTAQTTGSITTVDANTTTQVDGDSNLSGSQPYVILSNTVATQISESTLPSSWSLDGAVCLDSSGARVGSLSGTTYTLPANTITAGSTITCTFLNVKRPKLTLLKESHGGTGTFNYALTNTTPASTSITTASTGTQYPLAPTAIMANTARSDVVITETPASGFVLRSASCTDNNAISTGNIGSFGNLSGNTLTIDGSNVFPGADLRCVFINRRPTTLTLRKTWVNAVVNDTTVVSLKLNGSTQGSLSSTANTANDTDTGTAITVYTGEILNLSETLGSSNSGQYAASISCNNGVTVSPTGDLTVPATATTCTVTNRRTTTLTLRKTWVRAAQNDNAVVTLKRGASVLDSFTSNANSENETDTDSTPWVGYAGETLNLSETLGSGNVGQYTAVASCDNGVTVAANGDFVVPMVSSVVCTLTNTRNPVTFTGTVFNDNSGSTGDASNAYNGTRQAGENGLAGSTVQLTDCGSTILASTQTDASGQFQLSSNAGLWSGTVCLRQTNLPGYLSVSGGINGSGGYVRSTDTITRSITSAQSYPGNDFGDVYWVLNLTQDGLSTLNPGSSATYPHQLGSETPLTVSLGASTDLQPATSPVWSQLLYVDSNCNGQVDSSEPLWSGTLSLLPSQSVCLLDRVNAPANASAGTRYQVSLTATGTATLQDGTVVTVTAPVRTDLSLIGGGSKLEMFKQVRVVSACPSGDSSQTGFGTTNTARNGERLEYQIRYRNAGNRNLTQVTVKDSVPAGVLYQSGQCESTPASASCALTTAPSVGGSGALRWDITGLVKPADTGTVRFCTQIPALP